jgi:hypothetical protein
MYMGGSFGFRHQNAAKNLDLIWVANARPFDTRVERQITIANRTRNIELGTS